MNDLERKIKEIDIDNMRDQISSLYDQMEHSIDIMKDFTNSIKMKFHCLKSMD